MVAYNQRMKQDADRRRAESPFKEGMFVMMSTAHVHMPSPNGRKLGPLFIGPYRIVRMNGINAAELDLPESYRIRRTVNVAYLKVFNGDPANHRPPPLLLDDNGSPMFEVGAILDRRRANRKWLHLVKWLGYPADECTWEPHSHLAGTSAFQQYLHQAPPL